SFGSPWLNRHSESNAMVCGAAARECAHPCREMRSRRTNVARAPRPCSTPEFSTGETPMPRGNAFTSSTPRGFGSGGGQARRDVEILHRVRLSRIERLDVRRQEFRQLQLVLSNPLDHAARQLVAAVVVVMGVVLRCKSP